MWTVQIRSDTAKSTLWGILAQQWDQSDRTDIRLKVLMALLECLVLNMKSSPLAPVRTWKFLQQKDGVQTSNCFSCLATPPCGC